MEIKIHTVKVDGKDFAIVGGALSDPDNPSKVISGEAIANDPKAHSALIQKILAIAGQKVLVPLKDYEATLNAWSKRKNIPQIKTPTAQ